MLSFILGLCMSFGVHASDLQRDLERVAAKARPAVVSIQVNRSRRLAPEIHEVLLDFGVFPEPEISPERGASGSGVIVSAKGRVVTNFHVVQGVPSATVILANGERHEARVVGMDPRTDIAVLQLPETSRYPMLKFGDSSKLRVGHVVMAIGNPFDFSLSTTVGIVSAMGRRGLSAREIQDFIQTDAAVNPGNSGGPLINLKGQVVGINTAIFSVGREQNSGVSFAIPSNMADRIVKDLESLGRVRRARIGLVTERVHRSDGEAVGVEVTWVLPFGPAEKAGVRRGDRIVAANGEGIRSSKALKDLVQAVGVGATIQLDIEREEMVEHISVKTASADKVGLGVQELRAGDLQWAGASIVEANEELSAELGISPHRGIVVRSVQARSWASRLGLIAGDRILLVGGRKVGSLVELTGVLAGEEDGFATVGIQRATGALLLIMPTGKLQHAN